MTVYIEYVFFDNLVIDYLILKAAFFTLGMPFRRLRLFFCALAGAAFALLYPAMEIHPVILALVKIFMGLSMTLMAAKYGSFRRYFTVTALFFLYTFLLGGAITGVYYVLGLNPSSELSIALMVLPAYIIIKAAYSVVRYIYRRRHVASLVYKTEITLGSVTVTANGFLDTGNGLYLGDVPVIMCAKSVAEQFLCGGKLPDMKKITVRTVNGEEQKVVFMADIVKISAEKFVAEIKNVALCAVKSGFESGYEVILHPALLNLGNSEKKKEDNCAKVNENTADNKPLGTEERIEKDGNRGSTGEGADNKRKKGEEKRADEITDTCEKENILNERGGKAV